MTYEKRKLHDINRAIINNKKYNKFINMQTNNKYLKILIIMTRFITRRLNNRTAGSSSPFDNKSMGPVSTEWLTLYEQYLIHVRSLLSRAIDTISHY